MVFHWRGGCGGECSATTLVACRCEYRLADYRVWVYILWVNYTVRSIKLPLSTFSHLISVRRNSLLSRRSNSFWRGWFRRNFALLQSDSSVKMHHNWLKRLCRVLYNSSLFSQMRGRLRRLTWLQLQMHLLQQRTRGQMPSVRRCCSSRGDKTKPDWVCRLGKEQEGTKPLHKTQRSRLILYFKPHS